MSSNEYENSNVNIGYTQAAGDDGGQRLERVDHVYEEADVFVGQDGGQQPKTLLPAAERTFFNAASLTLGLIIVVSLVGILWKIVVIKDEQHGTVEIVKLKNDSANETERHNFCHSGWTRFRCHCYFTSTETRNWTESRRDCESRGAELVVIRNREEQEFIKEKLQRRGDSWIGLQAVTKDWKEEWQWVDGDRPKYIFWKLGVSLTAVRHHKFYITEGGSWMHINNGSKYWICQRQIF